MDRRTWGQTVFAGSVPNHVGAFFLAALLAWLPAAAQQTSERTLDLDGETLRYSLRVHPDDAHLLDASAKIEPTSALNTAKLLHRYLAAGDIEAAAALSNEPKRRLEVYREYRARIGASEFKRVFAEYFYPENKLVAEIAVGTHRLLIWRLQSAQHLAGQFYVETGDKVLMDDVPSSERTQLRRILEAYRSGKAAN